MSAVTGPTRAVLQQQAAADRGLVSATWRSLGTSVQLVVRPERLADAREAVQQVLSVADSAVSRFRADSELSRITPGTWSPVSPVLHYYLETALDAAEWTAGLVDPTVGEAPDPGGDDRRAAGWSTVLLERNRLFIPAGTRLDLGVTAKGLAADLAAARAAAVAGSVLVSLGGDVAVGGDAPDGGWPVVVAGTADPARIDATGQVVHVASGGLATAGTRSLRRWRDGRLLHHLLDPRTGAPMAGPWETVSVAASTCLLATTAATAAIVAGPVAVRWLQRRAFAARLVAVDGMGIVTGDWPSAEPS